MPEADSQIAKHREAEGQEHFDLRVGTESVAAQLAQKQGTSKGTVLSGQWTTTQSAWSLTSSLHHPLHMKRLQPNIQPTHRSDSHSTQPDIALQPSCLQPLCRASVPLYIGWYHVAGACMRVQPWRLRTLMHAWPDRCRTGRGSCCAPSAPASQRCGGASWRSGCRHANQHAVSSFQPASTRADPKTTV